MFVLLIGGQRDAAALFLGRLRAIAAPVVDEDPSVTAYVDEASAFWESYVERNPWAAMRLHAAAGQRLAIAEDLLSMPHSIAFMGWDCAMLGAFEEAERCVERSLSVARPARANEPLSRLVLANVRLGERRLDETVAAAEAALGEARSQGEGVVVMAAQLALAEARLSRGEVDAAAEVLDGSDAGGALGAPAPGIMLSDEQPSHVNDVNAATRHRALAQTLLVREKAALPSDGA